MNIGSLFVLLGVKGGDKTQKELKGVRDDMISISKRGLGAVAAIAGVSYGLKGLYDAAIRTGTGLSKFTNFTGESVEMLQRWQYMGRQFAVSNEEMSNSLLGIKSAMSEALINGQLPKSLQLMSQYINDFDPSRIEDTFYVLSKFQEFAKSNANQSYVNSVLGEYLSPDMIGFLRNNNLTPEMVPGSALVSNGQAKGMQKLQAAMSNVQNQLEVAMIKLANQVGPQLIKQFQDLIPQIVSLTKILSGILGLMLEFWAKPTDQLKDVGMGLTESTFWRQFMEDFMPWTTEKIKEWQDGGGIKGLNDRLSTDLANRMQGGASASGGTVVQMEQNNYGVSARDANMIGAKSAEMMARANKAQAKASGKVN